MFNLGLQILRGEFFFFTLKTMSLLSVFSKRYALLLPDSTTFLFPILLCTDLRFCSVWHVAVKIHDLVSLVLANTFRSFCLNVRRDLLFHLHFWSLGINNKFLFYWCEVKNIFLTCPFEVFSCFIFIHFSSTWSIFTFFEWLLIFEWSQLFAEGQYQEGCSWVGIQRHLHPGKVILWRLRYFSSLLIYHQYRAVVLARSRFSIFFLMNI